MAGDNELAGMAGLAAWRSWPQHRVKYGAYINVGVTA